MKFNMRMVAHACTHMYIIGGAVEMILTGGIVVSDDKRSQWYTLLGYLFLLGNTLCMVRLVVGGLCLIM